VASQRYTPATIDGKPVEQNANQVGYLFSIPGMARGTPDLTSLGREPTGEHCTRRCRQDRSAGVALAIRYQYVAVAPFVPVTTSVDGTA